MIQLPKATRTKNKYGNTRTEIDGHTFDSKGEANRWAELRMLEKAGVLTGLQRQVRFELLPPFVHDGKKEQGIGYIADFTYTQGGKLVIEDFKGARTEVFKLKRKLLLFRFTDFVFVESHK